MDQWLIRTAQNWIAGPYTKDQVRKMILEGQLTQQDEACPGNGYWIYLHEREELLRLLGIEAPHALSTAEEITETETQTGNDENNEETDPALSSSEGEAGTTVLKSRPMPVPMAAPAAGAASASVPPNSIVGTTVGPGAVWRTRGWLLIAGFCLLVFAVLRLIRD